jgi:CheY-like chemotaxis protein
MRVLLVDDEPGIAGALSAFLRLHGMDVQEAYDFESASKYLRENNWSILISDHNLPDGTGFELCQKFCEEDGGIALLLSAGSHPSFQEVENTKNFHFLPKPIAPGKLLTWIREKEKSLEQTNPEPESLRSEDPFQEAGNKLQNLGLVSSEIDHCLCSLFPALLCGDLKKTEVGESVVAFELTFNPDRGCLPREAVEEPFPGSDLWLVRNKEGTPIGIQIRVFRKGALSFESTGNPVFRPEVFSGWKDLLEKMEGDREGCLPLQPSWLRFGLAVLRREQSVSVEQKKNSSLNRLLWTRLDGLREVEQ